MEADVFRRLFEASTEHMNTAGSAETGVCGTIRAGSIESKSGEAPRQFRNVSYGEWLKSLKNIPSKRVLVESAGPVALSRRELTVGRGP
jgi:hypothetical protein